MTMTTFSSFAGPMQIQGMTGQMMAELLQEGYAPEKAYRIARSQVDEWVNVPETAVGSYHVTPHPLRWVIRQPTSATSCLVFPTQAEAIPYEQALAQRHGCNLIIHQANGRVHTRLAYA